MKVRTRNAFLAGFILIASLLCLVAVLPGGLFLAGDYLVHSDEPQKSGAVVLLSGGGDERMGTAARFMQERTADLLLLTDTGNTLPDGTEETNHLRIEMIERGVSPAQIQFTYRVVSSTAEEARAVREFLQQHKISSAVIVTDPYHTRRTRMLFRREFAGSDIEIRVVSAEGHWYKPATWFLSLRGWQTTIQEYTKLVNEELK